MPYIEHIDELVEDLANMAGVYGFARSEWVSEIQARIMAAVAAESRDELTLTRARIAELERERDEAQGEVARLNAYIQCMVEKAANKSLDGYRELGARAAAAENRADCLTAEMARLREALRACKNAAYMLPGGMGELPRIIGEITDVALAREKA